MVSTSVLLAVVLSAFGVAATAMIAQSALLSRSITSLAADVRGQGVRIDAQGRALTERIDAQGERIDALVAVLADVRVVVTALAERLRTVESR